MTTFTDSVRVRSIFDSPAFLSTPEPAVDLLKFVLRNYAGTPAPSGYYVVEKVSLPEPVLSEDVAHEICIVDESGSMYGSMTEMRSLVEKVFTLDEYTNAKLLVSLVGYSSKGDMRVYFERTPIAEVMKPGSHHVEAIRTMRARSMTCVSQALEYARTLVRGGETTAINVHTDGWFNHLSPAEETRRIEQFIRDMTPVKNVFVNTIGYGWADMGILARIANALSGKFVPATSMSQVYDAIHDTTQLLAGRRVPAIVVPLDGADFQVAASVSQRKVNGTTADLTLRGCTPTDLPETWRYRRVSEAAWHASPAKETHVDGGDTRPIYAFIRAKLAEGRINEAKYALISTRNQDLLDRHAKALTVEQVAAFAADIETALFETEVYTYTSHYGLDTSRVSIASLCKVLSEKKDEWTLDLPRFLATYHKRGIKRLAGTWEDVKNDHGEVTDRRFVPAHTRLSPVDDARIVSVGRFEFNNANATINMLVQRPANLVMMTGEKKGSVVAMVAGKKLQLKTNNNYTIVGDGAVNADILPVRIASHSLFEQLRAGKCILDTDYVPSKVYDIRLSDMPVLPYEQSFPAPVGIFRELALLKVQVSILDACLPGGTDVEKWIPEQWEELKSLHLTAALNHSPPTTTPYTDLDNAIATGLVDSRTGYKIEILDPEIAGLSSLYSANEYLRRRFVVVNRDGDEVEKPTMVDALAPGAEVRAKELSRRVQLGPVDTFMMPIFEQFFADLRKGLGTDLLARKRLLEREMENRYRDHVRPLAFYIGATGLLPDDWNVTAYTGEEIEEKYPSLKLEKKQKTGTFYVLPAPVGSTDDILVACYAENTWYSTALGVQAARDIAEDAEEAG